MVLTKTTLFGKIFNHRPQQFINNSKGDYFFPKQSMKYTTENREPLIFKGLLKDISLAEELRRSRKINTSVAGSPRLLRLFEEDSGFCSAPLLFRMRIDGNPYERSMIKLRILRKPFCFIYFPRVRRSCKQDFPLMFRGDRILLYKISTPWN